MSTSVSEFLAAKKTEAQKTYEGAVLAESQGQKLKKPELFVEAMGVLGKTLYDFERDLQVEREFNRLSQVASFEQSARESMHEAAEKRRIVLDEIREAEQLLKDKRRAAEADYDQKRRDFEKIHDASVQLSRSNAIGARVLREKLDAVLTEQRAVGEKLRQVRESLSRLRQNKSRLENEMIRVPSDFQLQDDYKLVNGQIREASSKENELVSQSETLQERYEAIRLSRGIDEAASVDEIDVL